MDEQIYQGFAAYKDHRTTFPKRASGCSFQLRSGLLRAWRRRKGERGAADELAFDDLDPRSRFLRHGSLGISFEKYILVKEKAGEEGKARSAHRAGARSNRAFANLERREPLLIGGARFLAHKGDEPLPHLGRKAAVDDHLAEIEHGYRCDNGLREAIRCFLEPIIENRTETFPSLRSEEADRVDIGDDQTLFQTVQRRRVNQLPPFSNS